ncbi:hypothetical protein GALMADRAFT_1048879 [Galerina marginata CBS 339.88]|uniref:Glucose receptor Git3 N-terminal domain-containing protein n=1 Tax=Galerina marginata (strain CBS 339.88) TaxID=685588 RepID=A0A067SBD4_GALM3|nr:hypothetical protein GALMADRAFT_1048879 [Galerina marginata CBS 339.88]
MNFTPNSTDDSTYFLTRGQRVGVTIMVEAGLASLLAVLYVSLIILRNFLWRIRNVSRGKWHVFQTPMDLHTANSFARRVFSPTNPYWFSLFSAELLQAIGCVMSLKWIHKGIIQVNGFCWAQGVVKQFGQTGRSITILLMTSYTFVELWLRKTETSMRVTNAVIFAAWLSVAAAVIIGDIVIGMRGEAPFTSPVPYWCWIHGRYPKWRILGEYLWIWVTLAISSAAFNADNRERLKERGRARGKERQRKRNSEHEQDKEKARPNERTYILSSLEEAEEQDKLELAAKEKLEKVFKYRSTGPSSADEPAPPPPPASQESGLIFHGTQPQNQPLRKALVGSGESGPGPSISTSSPATFSCTPAPVHAPPDPRISVLNSGSTDSFYSLLSAPLSIPSLQEPTRIVYNVNVGALDLATLSSYSLASSRTDSTDYGVYYTRWAISQDTIQNRDSISSLSRRQSWGSIRQ